MISHAVRIFFEKKFSAGVPYHFWLIFAHFCLFLPIFAHFFPTTQLLAHTTFFWLHIMTQFCFQRVFKRFPIDLARFEIATTIFDSSSSKTVYGGSFLSGVKRQKVVESSGRRRVETHYLVWVHPSHPP